MNASRINKVYSNMTIFRIKVKVNVIDLSLTWKGFISLLCMQNLYLLRIKSYGKD